MRKPVVDYRQFRFSKLNTPQFSHLWLLLCWVAYGFMYTLTERLIPAENCHIVYSPLDDIIPFCEVFVIPYVLWYGLIAGSLLYFLFYNVDNFKRLQIYIISVQVIATIIFIVYPNKQELRPEVFPRDNFLTDIVAWLYNADTNTGVCPSLHVAVSIGIASAWLKEKSVNWIFKTFIVLFCASVCLSTVFIKQHSVVDFFVALPMCLAVECLVFGKPYWLPKFKKLFKIKSTQTKKP
ncbi:MAG: phosphatidic acid phosphatase [Ruminococcaceae bacterium]|nr:phosphatidic acid phosphatase [Oscillospiraceae bacterium]